MLKHHKPTRQWLLSGFIAGSMIFFFCAKLAYAQSVDLRALYERASQAYNNQQYAQAIDLYQQIIKVVPNFAPAYNGMAMANQAASGDENKTIEYLKTAISYDPKLAAAYDNLGRIYYGRQDIDHAQENFEKALGIDPHLTSAQLCLGWINLLAKSRPEEAIKYFQMALKTSQDAKIYYGLGQAYFASNQRPQAMDMITKLRQLGEDDLASRLEKSMREHSEVNSQADTGFSNQASQTPGFGPLPATPDKPTGMKVRLRGKLSDY